ncbi:MAG: hypothetical protein GF334_12165 [Candidatus Altiarchaeales archaeon]|nr:hypothetical protein [Candidatus Altiarchaeales archaeon]
MSVFALLSKAYPSRVRDKFKDMLKYSTYKVIPEEFMGEVLTGSSVGAVILTLALTYFDIVLMHVLVTFIACFIVLQAAVVVWLSLNISKKANIVDESLPDALQLMSSNIRAGLTTDKALLMAARPEFGPLEAEIRRIGKETMAGKSLTSALKKTTEHIKSHDLERTVELMIYSIDAGGQLGDLLDQTADDIRDQQMLRKEVKASVLMYVMFIFIAIAIGAPALFAMSSFLVELLTRNMNLIASEMPSDFSSAGGSAMPISITEIKITAEFIRRYSLVSLTLSSFFGAMVMGLIMRGEEKAGFKYFPPMVAIAIILFLVAGFLLQTLLGGMMSI